MLDTEVPVATCFEELTQNKQFRIVKNISYYDPNFVEKIPPDLGSFFCTAPDQPTLFILTIILLES